MIRGERKGVCMLELIRNGIKVAGVLFFPLMLVAVPLMELSDILAEAHWRIAVLLGGLRWALLCGYAGILLTMTASARLTVPSWPNLPPYRKWFLW